MTVLVRMLDAIIDRLADELENVGAEIEKISTQIFGRDIDQRRIPAARLTALLTRIGRTQTLLAKIRVSEVSTTRMGVLPLQFRDGENAESLGLDGSETFSIDGVASIEPRQDVEVKVKREDGSTASFTARCRIDTYNELEYFRSGGILQYVLRRLAAG